VFPNGSLIQSIFPGLIPTRGANSGRADLRERDKIMGNPGTIERLHQNNSTGPQKEKKNWIIKFFSG
jgi:hypothetical protein